jgi:hypothetical protein
LKDAEILTSSRGKIASGGESAAAALVVQSWPEAAQPDLLI